MSATSFGRRIGLVLSVWGLAACSMAPGDEAIESDDDLLQQIKLSVDESALDRSVQPCDDFFAFACGGYLKANPIASEEDRHQRAFDAANVANKAVLADIFAEATTNPTSDVDERLGALHTSCTSAKARPSGDAAQIAALREGGNAINYIRRTDGLGAALAELALRGVRDAFVSASVWADTNADASKMALHVAPPFIATLSESDLATRVAQLYPSDSAEARAERVRTIRALDEAIRTATAVSDPVFHPIGKDGLASVVKQVDWNVYLRRLGIPQAKRINVVNVNALSRIDAVIAGVSEEQLATYVDYKYAAAFLGTLGAGMTADAARTSCESSVLRIAPSLVTEKFIARTVDPKADRLQRAMAKTILATFQARLAEIDFLDPATRVEALTKARGMLVTPLYQARDTFEGVAITPESFTKNWELVRIHTLRSDFGDVDRAVNRTELLGGTNANAFYSADENRIAILPGILQGAFFGADAPKILNVGAIGWVMGHEVTHGFDDSGRRFDAQGRERDWWSPTVSKAYDERAQCFVDQYGGFDVEETVDPATGKPLKIDGKLTLGENIADNGGMRLAYDAATPYLATTPVQAGFTPEQQFFLMGAQMWCGNKGSKAAAAALSSDPHSPYKARVNVTMSNFEKFAAAFQCKAGQKMVGAPSCRIW